MRFEHMQHVCTLFAKQFGIMNYHTKLDQMFLKGEYGLSRWTMCMVLCTGQISHILNKLH